MESNGKISAGELGELLSGRGIPLSDRRLRQLAEHGFFPAPIKGQYELVGTLLGLVAHYRALRTREAGGLAAERLRKTREEADRIALDNERTRGSLVEVERVYKLFEPLFIAFRARILASGLSDGEKDEILTDLRGLKSHDLGPEPANASLSRCCTR